MAVIDAGRHGKLNSGHAHADALSCTLALGEQPLFIDRGTLTYMGAERNDWDRRLSHNTLEFDGESSVTPLGPFHWGPRPHAATAAIRDCNEEISIFRGMARGRSPGTTPDLDPFESHRPRAAVTGISGPRIQIRELAGVGAVAARPDLAVRSIGGNSFDVIDHHGDLVARVAFQ